MRAVPPSRAVSRALSFALALAACGLCAASAVACGDAAGEDGPAALVGRFDGVPFTSEDGGALLQSASLEGRCLDVTVRYEGPGATFTVVLVTENPSSDLEGVELAVGAAGVTATVSSSGSGLARTAQGTARFDALDPTPGGVVAGEFDLEFAGGYVRGTFDTTVR